MIDSLVVMNLIRDWNYYTYVNHDDDVLDEIEIKLLKIFDWCDSLSDVFQDEVYKIYCRMLSNRYHKKSRLYSNIEFMLNTFDVCYFCTFTLNDEHIDCDLKYLKKCLTQMLKRSCCCYVGNVDFGEKKGRMHFHVILAQDTVKINKDLFADIWDNFGWFDIKVINDKDEKKLGSYIMKLVNHATKETTKDRIITPRGEFGFKSMREKFEKYKDGIIV